MFHGKISSKNVYRKVRSIYTHSKYSPVTFTSDISLLKVSTCFLMIFYFIMQFIMIYDYLFGMFLYAIMYNIILNYCIQIALKILVKFLLNHHHFYLLLFRLYSSQVLFSKMYRFNTFICNPQTY